MNKAEISEKKKNQQADNPNLWEVILSTFAAAFGVQNKKNLEKDFKHGSIKAYIIAGLIFTTLFVLTLIFIVKLVLNGAGG